MTVNNAMLEKHSELWSRQLQHSLLRYPDTSIVVYLAKNWPDRAANKGRKALDIGFGSANSFPVFNDYGFEVHGIDISERAVSGGKAMLEALNIKGQVTQVALENVTYPAQSFDLVVSWGCLFLAPYETIRANVQRCYDLLKPGGGLLINFRSEDNWFFGFGEPVDAFCYELDERAGPYSGNTYSFLPELQSRALLEGAGFVIDNMERLDNWKLNGTQQHSWNIYWARKP